MSIRKLTPTQNNDLSLHLFVISYFTAMACLGSVTELAEYWQLGVFVLLRVLNRNLDYLPINKSS